MDSRAQVSLLPISKIALETSGRTGDEASADLPYGTSAMATPEVEISVDPLIKYGGLSNTTPPFARRTHTETCSFAVAA